MFATLTSVEQIESNLVERLKLMFSAVTCGVAALGNCSGTIRSFFFTVSALFLTYYRIDVNCVTLG